MPGNIMNENQPLVTEQEDKLTTDEQIANMLAPAIALTLDLEMNFKLYSHRVITREVFLDHINEAVATYKMAVNALTQ